MKLANIFVKNCEKLLQQEISNTKIHSVKTIHKLMPKVITSIKKLTNNEHVCMFISWTTVQSSIIFYQHKYESETRSAFFKVQMFKLQKTFILC